jgi:hypothetical protein
MDSLMEMRHPQAWAAALALTQLGLVAVLELLMVWHAVRHPARAAQRPPVAEESLNQEAYDWLYE